MKIVLPFLLIAVIFLPLIWQRLKKYTRATIEDLKSVCTRLIDTIEKHTGAVEANTAKVAAVESLADETRNLHQNLKQWREDLARFQATVDAEIQTKIQQYIKQGFDRWNADEATKNNDQALRKAK
jgi:hypothetical protein